MSEEKGTQQMIESALTRIPYVKTLGIKPLLMGSELTLILPFRADLIGSPVLQALHGGAVGAFMETTALVQVGALSPEGRLPKPIGINIDFLRRGLAKDTYARAFIARQGSRVANVRVLAWQENQDTPIATLHGNFLTAKDEPN